MPGKRAERGRTRARGDPTSPVAPAPAARRNASCPLAVGYRGGTLMQNRNRALLDGAVLISREIGANAILLAAALPREARYLRRAVGSACRVITATGAPGGASGVERDVLSLPEVRLRRRGRAKIALLEALAAGMLRDGDRVIILSGDVSNRSEERRVGKA